MTALAARVIKPVPAPEDVSPGASHFLEVADGIGRRLVRDAIWSGDRCNWLGWSMEPLAGTFRTVYRSLQGGLYQGVAGVARFLSHLVRYTRDPRQVAIRDGALRQVLSQLPALERQPFAGYYAGAVGVAHVLLEAGELTSDERLVSTGLGLLERTASVEIGPQALDWMGGCAGTIPLLLDVAERHGRPQLVDMASRLGSILVERARHVPEGVCWPNPDASPRGLTGLSHGTAGFALGLLELHRVRPGEQLLAAARGALRYERSLFHPHRGWPDLRQMGPQPPKEPGYPVAWCHGAVGIGMSRLRLMELLPDDPQLIQELEVAINLVLAQGGAPAGTGITDFTLCHGLAANAEFLLMAADKLGRPELRHAAERMGQHGIDMFWRTGLPWPCGVLGAGETPALMTGISGIGHFYLRLHDFQRVPSVLLMTPGT